MPDGCRLAARIWLPEGAENQPVPGILEYIPYRKNDGTALRDSITHPYLAAHGYACVRVDIRGSGESDGVLTDEYLQQELDDGVEILRWMARQPWCNGSIGIMGISWGGFNGLQIAAMQPKELKAVITLSSTDDRYSDDVHHMGGCLLGDNLSWASTMFAYNSLPPDPRIVGDQWKKMWLDRLSGSGLWLEKWLRHQRRDDYWKHGSICEDFSAVTCPVLAVSGWADGYTNSVFRLLQNLKSPRKALIGPWSHKYPHMGVPGPAIDFLGEALRWWDRWLKGIDNGVMDEPMLRVWMQESVPPTTRYKVRPGRWVGENSWPSPRIEKRNYPFGRWTMGTPGQLMEDAELTIQSPLSVGLFAGKWCSYSATPDLPHDQREEDGGALVYQSHPLDEDIEILGAPRVHLELTSSEPVAMVAVRLSDVAPDDKATRVTYGLLNLCQRNSNEQPEPLESGETYQAWVQLNDVAQTLPKGHSLRVSISTSYWPLAWPPPKPVRLKIKSHGSFLELPVRPLRSEDKHLREIGPPQGAEPEPVTCLRPGRGGWYVKRDLALDESQLIVEHDRGIERFERHGLEVETSSTEIYSYCSDDFDSIRGEAKWLCGFKRGDWQIETQTRTIITSTATHFRIRADLDAYENDTRVFSRSWDEWIERDYV